MRRNVLKKPRNLELLLYISRHEGICASELDQAGFTKPGVYILLASLKESGLIRMEPFEIQTGSGTRLRKVFHLTEKGKAMTLHLIEMEKIVGQGFNGRPKKVE